MKLFGLSSLSVLATTMIHSASAHTVLKFHEKTMCQNVDFYSCDPNEHEVFASLLQKTFNEVFSPVWTLSETKWEGVIPPPPVKNDRRVLYPEGGGSGSHLDCYLCDDDYYPYDDDVSVAASNTMALKKDMDNKKDKKDMDKKDKKEWEKKLTRALKESGMTCFKNAADCTVETKHEKLSVEATAVRVECQNVDWDVLTSSEERFAASELENAFNNVHASDENKKLIQNMASTPEVEKVSSLIDSLTGIVWQSKYGYFSGSFYASSQDGHAEGQAAAMLRRTNQNDVTALDLWENEFEKLLHRGPYSALSRASDCHIEMKVMDNNKSD